MSTTLPTRARTAPTPCVSALNFSPSYTSSGALARRQDRGRIVADDSLYALAPQPQRVSGVVDGPDMDHGTAAAHGARQRGDGHRDAVPERRDAQRLKGLRADAPSHQCRQQQPGDIGRARTEGKAGAAQRARRVGVEAGDDDALRDAV